MMKKSKKKIGTLMDERLLYEAKKAALEKSIPFHRFVEEAVEQYIRKSAVEGKTAAEKRNGRISGISEKNVPYRVRASGMPVPGENPANDPTTASLMDRQRPPLDISSPQRLSASFSVPLEERWKRAGEVIGRYHSGRNDISERHDEFVAEAFSAEEEKE